MTHPATEDFQTIQKERFEKRLERDIFFYRWRLETPYIFDKFKSFSDQYIPQEAQDVLELGCGDGAVCHYFKDRKPEFRYTGIDRAIERLEFAKKQSPQCDFIGGDIRELPFESGVFDAVMCHGVFHHLEPQDFKRVFEEMTRILRPGGTIFFLEPNGRSLFYWLLGLLSKAERGILNLNEANCRKGIKAISGCTEPVFIYKEAFLPFDILTQFFFRTQWARSRRFAEILWKIEKGIEKILPKDRLSVMIGIVKKS